MTAEADQRAQQRRGVVPAIYETTSDLWTRLDRFGRLALQGFSFDPLTALSTTRFTNPSSSGSRENHRR